MYLLWLAWKRLRPAMAVQLQLQPVRAMAVSRTFCMGFQDAPRYVMGRVLVALALRLARLEGV